MSWKNSVHICHLGKIYRFRFLDRTWYIELTVWGGPMWLKADFEPRKNPQPGRSSPFWKAVAHLEAMTPAKRQRCEI